VRDLQYRPGKFLDARLPETTDVNEAMSVYLDTEHGPMTVRQISGLIARRIVCRCQIGDSLARGQKFGMIKFGSRTEIYLPPNTEVLVKVGDKVKAGESVVSRFI
jgi:phosphatidylserine decarboxylase